MAIILKIGMDVHSTTHALCALRSRIGAEAEVIARTQVAASTENIIKFIENVKEKLGNDKKYDIECGYEAGCLGYSLQKELTAAGYKCTILAPSTIPTAKGKNKTDPRDALDISHALAYGTYKRVYVTTEQDNEVKIYIRMRDDHQNALKKIKQQISAFCLTHGLYYDRTKWTQVHLKWLRDLVLLELDREILNEYMITYDSLTDRIGRMDARIEELALQARYKDKVKRLCCFSGIKTHTAISLIVEVGDFYRFAKGNIFSSFLGVTPGEYSSGKHTTHTGITKAGNSHLRRLLIEAAGAICRGTIGHKSKALKARQQGNSPEIIAFADRVNSRLRSRYYKHIRKGMKRNIAIVAIARELACFIWGMMTQNMQLHAA